MKLLVVVFYALIVLTACSNQHGIVFDSSEYISLNDTLNTTIFFESDTADIKVFKHGPHAIIFELNGRPFYTEPSIEKDTSSGQIHAKDIIWRKLNKEIKRFFSKIRDEEVYTPFCVTDENFNLLLSYDKKPVPMRVLYKTLRVNIADTTQTSYSSRRIFVYNLDFDQDGAKDIVIMTRYLNYWYDKLFFIKTINKEKYLVAEVYKNLPFQVGEPDLYPPMIDSVTGLLMVNDFAHGTGYFAKNITFYQWDNNRFNEVLSIPQYESNIEGFTWIGESISGEYRTIRKDSIFVRYSFNMYYDEMVDGYSKSKVNLVSNKVVDVLYCRNKKTGNFEICNSGNLLIDSSKIISVGSVPIICKKELDYIRENGTQAQKDALKKFDSR